MGLEVRKITGCRVHSAKPHVKPDTIKTLLRRSGQIFLAHELRALCNSSSVSAQGTSQNNAAVNITRSKPRSTHRSIFATSYSTDRQCCVLASAHQPERLGSPPLVAHVCVRGRVGLGPSQHRDMERPMVVVSHPSLCSGWGTRMVAGACGMQVLRFAQDDKVFWVTRFR
jgi:hypothetical protein